MAAFSACPVGTKLWIDTKCESRVSDACRSTSWSCTRRASSIESVTMRMGETSFFSACLP